MKKKQSHVSCREYYSYKLQIRPSDKSVLLHSDRLFQQYVVNMYVKIETSRLDYFRSNQKQIRAELYQSIVDSIHNGEKRGYKIGKKFVLPHSFTCGPRDMLRMCLDAMALVQRYGKPDLFITITFIVKHNMHDPNGNLNPKNTCMENNSCCKNKYPKDYCNSTMFGDNSYPPYRRCNIGIYVKVRGKMLDNQWVVPYNPYLSAKFDYHINVETYKDIDEIFTYQSARWISPPEAMWRIFAINLSKIYPVVCVLQLHIEDHQWVTYKNTDNLSSIIENENTRKTMLTEFFRVNKINEFAQMLLGPTSFDDLRTFNGVNVGIFCEAALLYGLLNGDTHCEECLSETIIYEMPYSLRILFATLLTMCNPNNPKLLWDKFKPYIINDYVNENMPAEVVEVQALEDISSILESFGKNINDYGIVSFNVNIDDDEILMRMVVEEPTKLDIKRNFSCAATLNKEQQFTYNTIMEKVQDESSEIFFIDGPGGKGKTFYIEHY
ncbi:uncharacterized protein LOC111365519 [Olea europaea var. sylvestris]|uniref:uncharacterized protein LOC111365519 n=1 Tax=Olea europaea var. sylvestris TaxID=158386 RepID=UPI000C1CEB01|nr:uncharacterized protein LOC111365519 [Olea europaea var. sylvestris]